MSKMSDLDIERQETVSKSYDAGYKQCVEDFKLGRVYDVDNAQAMSQPQVLVILNSCQKAITN